MSQRLGELERTILEGLSRYFEISSQFILKSFEIV